MEAAGDRTEPLKLVMMKANVLLLPPPRWCFPTCQETQLTMPSSSASTGGLSEMVEEHYFDSYNSLSSLLINIKNDLH